MRRSKEGRRETNEEETVVNETCRTFTTTRNPKIRELRNMSCVIGII